METAREDWFPVPAYRGYLEAFLEVAAEYVIHQLSTALGRWMFLPWLDSAEHPEPGMVDLHALAPYLFMARHEAWQRLCEEYGVNGDDFLDRYDAYDQIKLLEELLCPVASSREEADARVRKHYPEDRAITTEEIYQSMKAQIEDGAKRWVRGSDLPDEDPDLD